MRLPLATLLMGILLAGCGLMLELGPETDAGADGAVVPPRDAWVPPRDARVPPDASGPDGGSADGGGADADRADSGDPDPCEDVTNWTCIIDGGGDCIAECGRWSVEIFTFSSEFLCFTGGRMLSCPDPGLRNCDGCMQLARNRCCFPP